MSWVGATGFARRPLVVVEDHLHHVGELLAALAGERPDLLARTTVLCADRPGPDTTRLVARWLAAYPALQVAARIDPVDSIGAIGAIGAGEMAREPRFSGLDAGVFTAANRFCKTLAALLRPGGLLLQDIQLSTLGFIPPERWWESIYLASMVRGMFAGQPPTCRFLSNKRGYEATFGRDLLDAGFDPREVLDKSELRETVVPVVSAALDRAFPLDLQVAAPPGGGAVPADAAVARTEEDRREIERELDLVVWASGPAPSPIVEMGGRLVAGDGERRLSLKAGGQEAVTWAELVEDRFRGGSGVPVVDVGARLAPDGAGRAEITNLAARHVHGLRGRLRDGGAIVTAHHAYRLAETVRVGRVVPRG